MNRYLAARTNALFVACAKKNIAITPLALQKLVYFDYIIVLQNDANNILDYLQFEAWDYGPVLPDVYHYYKAHHHKPLRAKIKVGNSYPVLFDDNTIGKCVRKYARMDPFELVRLTHKKNGAWWKAYSANGTNNIIRHQDIIEEFCNVKNKHK